MVATFGIPYDAKADPLQEMRASKPQWQTRRPIRIGVQLVKLSAIAGESVFVFEGGSTCALAGENFAIVASDTRNVSDGNQHHNRDAEKVHVLNDSIILAKLRDSTVTLCSSSECSSPAFINIVSTTVPI
ncbi:hypothetical protein OSTOST_02983 [Ostertagia ostertagi]